MRRRGSILILVLFLLAILSLVGLSFAYRTGLSSAEIRHEAVRAKLRTQAASAAAVVVARIRQDRLDEKNTFDHPGEAWAQPGLGEAAEWLEAWRGDRIGHKEPEYALQLRVVDEIGKMNVNYASSEQMLAMGLSPEQAQAVMDWMDEDDLAGPGGAESRQYRSRGYRCKNRPMDELEELLLVAGIEPPQYFGPELARDFCTGAAADEPPEAAALADQPPGLVHLLRAFGDDGVNLNTAPREVLAAMDISPEAVGQIIAYRRCDGDSADEIESHAFRSPEDIEQLQGLEPADRAWLMDHGRYRSDCFRIFAVARHGPTGLRLALEVLVEFTEGDARVLRWKETSGC